MQLFLNVLVFNVWLLKGEKTREEGGRKGAPVITLGRKREIHFGLEVIFQGGRTGVWGKVLNIANPLEDQPREDKHRNM